MDARESEIFNDLEAKINKILPKSLIKQRQAMQRKRAMDHLGNKKAHKQISYLSEISVSGFSEKKGMPNQQFQQIFARID